MPVPVWVSDFAFVPNSEQVVSSSRHGHVRNKKIIKNINLPHE